MCRGAVSLRLASAHVSLPSSVCGSVLASVPQGLCRQGESVCLLTVMCRLRSRYPELHKAEPNLFCTARPQESWSIALQMLGCSFGNSIVDLWITRGLLAAYALGT